MKKARNKWLFAIVVAVSIYRSVLAGEPDARLVLARDVNAIIGVPDDLEIGSLEFNKAVQQKLTMIGFRRDCVEAVLLKAGARRIAVDVYSHGLYLAFNFEKEGRRIPAGGFELISVVVQVQWNSDLRPQRVESVIRAKVTKPVPPEDYPDNEMPIPSLQRPIR